METERMEVPQELILDLLLLLVLDSSKRAIQKADPSGTSCEGLPAPIQLPEGDWLLSVATRLMEHHLGVAGGDAARERVLRALANELPPKDP
jgi:hypothetical protein